MSIVPAFGPISNLGTTFNTLRSGLRAASAIYNSYQRAAPTIRSIYNSLPSMRRRSSNSSLRGPPAKRPRLMSYASSRRAGTARRPSRSWRFKRSYKRRYPRRYKSRRRFTRRTKKSIYTRRYKGVRRFNRGKFNIGSLLSQGGSLPRQTFVRMQYRVSSTVVFNSGAAACKSRIIEPNSVVFQSNLVDNPSAIQNQWQYLDVFKTFYGQYLILGAKTKITIQPTNNPERHASVQAANLAPNLTAGDSTGYWYCRLCYVKDGEQVGHDINDDGVFDELINWPTMRDFLVDPTVMYVKDRAPNSYKYGYIYANETGQGASSHPFILPYNDPTPRQFYCEAEVKNHNVTFTVKFSAKNHFGDKNYLKNGDWRDWSQGSLDGKHRFRAFVGYVAFDSSNDATSQAPSNGFARRRLTVETTAYAALQDPRITPSSKIVTPEGRLLFEQDEEKEKALKVMNYAITRNQEDVPTPELENELDEEIENLLEESESEEDPEESDLE